LSVPYADPTTWVPLAVLVASLAGSGHCVSMCGGLVVATAKGPATWVSYHLGRLLGYLSLGALAGLIGSEVLGASPETKWLSLATALILGLGFVLAGIRIWQGRVPHFSVVPKSLLMRAYRGTRGNALATGLLTAFLPCGWLHAFVLGSVATRSPALGAGFLFMFWLGTLPALAATPWLVKRIFQPMSSRAPRVAGIVLILAGIISVGAKVLPFASTDDGKSSRLGHCSHHAQSEAH
jgi:uncharacterized protein